jgi:uncharacterized protein YukE
MKHVVAVSILLFSAVFGLAQAGGTNRPSPAQTPAPVPPSSLSQAPNLDAILAEVQQATQSANIHITQLRIDRWKADSAGKAELQHVADSLHKNITNAVPDLIGEVRSSHGSVSSTFRLYHNINVVFEYLGQLTDGAGSAGKQEEYDPLNRDLTALDKARQHLSAYIEQAAASLENKVRTSVAVATPAPTPQPAPKKIIVDDDTPHKKPATTQKQKTSAPPPKPSPTPN